MRITKISVDGFGQFHGAHLEPAAGLTVIRGVNEAGKTTLLAFVRAILFGFETDRYPALSGGRRGGWLDVEMHDGRQFRIERFGEKGGAGSLQVLDEYDTNLGEGYLATLLQGVERKVYRNIFAFGLEELTQFERLTDNEVAARIYGAGLGTGSVSGLDVENALRDEREALFKPGGQNPKINGLLRILEETDERLRDRDLPADYGEAGARLSEVEQRLVDVNGRHAVLAAERRSRQRVIDGWSTWLDLLASRAAREELGPVRTFAPGTLERLGRLETAVTAADEAARLTGLARARAAAELEGAVVDEDALAQRPELEAMIEASRVETARRDERARTERELAAAATQVGSAVTQLGPGWSVERVEAFDDSIPVHAEIGGRFRALLDQATDAVATARRELTAAEDRLAEVTVQAEKTAARVGELEADLGARPPHATRDRALREIEDLVRRIGALREAATEIPGMDLAAARASLDQRARDAQELRTALESERNVRELLTGAVAPTSPASPSSWRPLVPAIALAAGGIVVALVLTLAGAPPVAALLVVITAVVVAAAMAIFARRPTGPSAVEGIRHQLEGQLERATTAIARNGPALGLGATPAPDEVIRLLAAQEEERRELDRQVDRRDRAEAAAREATSVERRLAATAAAVGLPAEPSPGDLESFEAQVTADRELDARRAGLLEQLVQLRSAAESLSRRREELAKALDERASEAEHAREEWKRWLEAHDLDAALDRETAARVVEAVSSAKAAVAAMRSLEDRRDGLAEAHAGFVSQIAALAPLLPNGRFDEAELAAATALLEQRLVTALAGEQARADLARELAGRAIAQTKADDALARARQAVDELLGGFEIPDAASLRAEVDRTTHAAGLDERLAAATATLTALSGPGDALTTFQADLDLVADIDLVGQEIDGLDGQIVELAGERDTLNQEAGALRNRRAEMERDAAATEMRQRRADVQAQLKAAAERWTVLALAHDMLARSRAAYEEAHRPAVVQAAERYFAEWTDGRYRRIIAPLGSSIEGVERGDGTRVPLAGLSRGTSEQLYLALRFGLVEHFVEASHEPLPIVMDDILVNFDDDRAARAARSIESLSKVCQIIYFTCHPTTPLQAEVEKNLPRLEVQ